MAPAVRASSPCRSRPLASPERSEAQGPSVRLSAVTCSRHRSSGQTSQGHSSPGPISPWMGRSVLPVRFTQQRTGLRLQRSLAASAPARAAMARNPRGVMPGVQYGRGFPCPSGWEKLNVGNCLETIGCGLHLRRRVGRRSARWRARESSPVPAGVRNRVPCRGAAPCRTEAFRQVSAIGCALWRNRRSETDGVDGLAGRPRSRPRWRCLFRPPDRPRRRPRPDPEGRRRCRRTG